MSCTRIFAPLRRQFIAPRTVACPQHFRFSTAPRLCAQEPSVPPNASTQIPSQPKDAARAADLAATEAGTESDSAQPVQQKPVLPSKRPEGSVKPLTDGLTPLTDTPPQSASSSTTKPKKTSSRFTTAKAPQSTLNITLPPPRYHVSRSATKNLPIYTDFKRGGNLHQTTVRKITGDASQLRDELSILLNKKEGDVKVNTLTQHVIVKGHHVAQIAEFLKSRGM